MKDMVDELLESWAEELPQLDCSALGVVVRVQLLAKLLAESAEAALTPLGLKLWEYDVLSALRRQGAPYELPVSELARESLLTAGSVTTRTDGLVTRGLVTRRSDAQDRRMVWIRLTDQGLATIEDAINVRIGRADEQLEVLSARERKALSVSLRKVLAAMVRE